MQSRQLQILQAKLSIIVDRNWHDVGILNDATKDWIYHHSQQANLGL